jgi:hypothetical protein
MENGEHINVFCTEDIQSNFQSQVKILSGLLGMVVHTCNPSTWEAKAGEPSVQG